VPAACTDPDGWVSAIHRGSLHDGPGLRTTVFLQGCHLRCAWCHNPETWAPRPRLAWLAADCLGCQACAASCSQDLLQAGPRAAPTGCAACGDCNAACPSGALRLQGQRRSAASVLDEVLRDAATLRAGGGITVSGGEPLDQPDFTSAILARAGAAGLHRCLDTSGDAPAELLRALLPLVDCWLLDWKCSDDSRHRALTGVGNARIGAAVELLAQAGARIWLRCPLIPGLNDDDGHLAGIAALSRRPAIERVEIMPFHRHGAGKAAANGRRIHDAPSATAAQAAVWRSRLAELGCRKLLAA
jgi:glycyl-radical enzyme activating protein